MRTDLLMDLYSLCSIAASLCLAGIQVVADAPELSVIAGAAAQIACQKCTDLIVRRIGILPEQGDGVHHKARVAEAALVGTLVGDEADKVGGLRLQALQGADLMAVGPDRQGGAGQNGLAVHQHGAKTAVGGVAASFYAEAA